MFDKNTACIHMHVHTHAYLYISMLDFFSLHYLLLYIKSTIDLHLTVAYTIKNLNCFQVLGNGFEVISLGKKKLVRSVPTELNKDHNEILELAQVSPCLCVAACYFFTFIYFLLQIFL